ncbi:MAG: RuvA C-terminal domain-containing protein [Nitrosomonadales bacterium]|nr:RuvA C-terminal domain-containing protein [Nitrosomonadales bacterium]
MPFLVNSSTPWQRAGGWLRWAITPLMLAGALALVLAHAAPVETSHVMLSTKPASSDITNALQALGYTEKETSWPLRSAGIRQSLKLLSKG